MLQFPGHYLALREIDGLSDAAFRLHMSALFWADVNSTGGLIPAGDLKLVARRIRNPARLAAECVRRGAWHEAGHDCGSPNCTASADDGDGWVIHDFRLLLAEDEKESTGTGKSAGGRLGNHRRWHEQRGLTDPACAYCAQDTRRSDPRSHSDSDSDRTSESHTDENSDRTANPDRSDQNHHQSSVIALVKRSDPREDIAPDRVSDEVAAAAALAIEARTGEPASEADARTVAAAILSRARQAGKHVRNQVRYVTAAIENESDLRGILFGPAGPSLEQILDDFRQDRESGPERHEYQPGPNDRCVQCHLPKPNQRHQAAKTA